MMRLGQMRPPLRHSQIVWFLLTARASDIQEIARMWEVDLLIYFVAAVENVWMLFLCSIINFSSSVISKVSYIYNLDSGTKIWHAEYI